jgi:hypothetical protein
MRMESSVDRHTDMRCARRLRAIPRHAANRAALDQIRDRVGPYSDSVALRARVSARRRNDRGSDFSSIPCSSSAFIPASTRVNPSRSLYRLRRDCLLISGEAGIGDADEGGVLRARCEGPFDGGFSPAW